MAGHKPWKELRNRMMRDIDADPERRARYERARDEAQHLATLSQIRQALELTQQQLAERTEMTQSAISQIERRGMTGDLFLSTLRRYVEGLGGSLEVTALIGAERIPLDTGIGSAATEPPSAESSYAAYEKLHAAMFGRASSRWARLAGNADISVVVEGKGQAWHVKNVGRSDIHPSYIMVTVLHTDTSSEGTPSPQEIGEVVKRAFAQAAGQPAE